MPQYEHFPIPENFDPTDMPRVTSETLLRIGGRTVLYIGMSDLPGFTNYIVVPGYVKETRAGKKPGQYISIVETIKNKKIRAKITEDIQKIYKWRKVDFW